MHIIAITSLALALSASSAPVSPPVEITRDITNGDVYNVTVTGDGYYASADDSTNTYGVATNTNGKATGNGYYVSAADDSTNTYGVATNTDGKTTGNKYDVSVHGSAIDGTYSFGTGSGKRSVPPLSSTSSTVQGEASRLIGTAKSAAGTSNPTTSSSTVTSRTVGQLPGDVGSPQVDTVVDKVKQQVDTTDKLGNPSTPIPSSSSTPGSVDVNGHKVGASNGLRARILGGLGGVVGAATGKASGVAGGIAGATGAATGKVPAVGGAVSDIVGATGGKVRRDITDEIHPPNSGNGVQFGGSASGSAGGEVRRDGAGPLPSGNKVDTSDLKDIPSTLQSAASKAFGSRAVGDIAGTVVSSIQAATGKASGVTGVVGKTTRDESGVAAVEGAVKKLGGATGSNL